MLLNRIEKALVNNPIRAFVQRRFEVRWLQELGGTVPGATVLEVGCGRGVGTRLILEEFGAARVDAFDLDPHMVELARRRLACQGERVRLWVGDVTRIAVPDAAYDAVFDFAIIHHAPDWRAALAEIHRVLKPGGRFFAAEVLRDFIVHPVVRRVLEHPLEDRFAHEQFCEALAQAGFRLVGERRLGRWFGWYVADRPRAAGL